MKKRRILQQAVTLLITCFIIFSVTYMDTASAVQVRLDLPSSVIDGGVPVSFIAVVDIPGLERIPIDNLTITIGSDTCTFSLNGSILSDNALCESLHMTMLEGTFTEGPRYGYGYGYINDLYQIANTSFGYGYGYSTTPESIYGDISYNITWTTPTLSSNTHYSLRLSVNTPHTERSNYITSTEYDLTVRRSSSSSSHLSGSSFVPPLGVQSANTTEPQQFTDMPQPQIYDDSPILLVQAHSASIIVTKVSVIPENPTITKPSATIYRYLEIATNVSDKIANITFSVGRQWLIDNNASSGDVILYRYHESRWNQLPTSILLQNATHFIYTALTPGFSYFAIGLSENVNTSTYSPEVLNRTDMSTGTKEPTVTTKPQITDITLPEHETAQKFIAFFIWGFMLVISLIVIAYVILHYGRFRKYRYALHAFFDYWLYNYYNRLARKCLLNVRINLFKGESYMEKYHNKAKKAYEYFFELHRNKLNLAELERAEKIRELSQSHHTTSIDTIRSKIILLDSEIEYHKHLLEMPRYTVEFIMHGLHKPGSNFEHAKFFMEHIIDTGGSVEEVKRLFIIAGWPEYTVEMMANNRQRVFINKSKRLEEYIISQRNKGMPDTFIRQTLIKVGWPPKIIDLVMYGVHKINGNSMKFERYVLYCLSNGESPADIRARLLAIGWPESVIDDLIYSTN